MSDPQYTLGERFVLAVTAKLPRWILEQPERIVLNAACFVMGLAMLMPPPENNVLATFPTMGRYVLASLLIVGAGVSLYGTYTVNRAADRLGALTLGGASLFMSLLLFGSVGLRAVLTGVIFFAIFLAKLLRFLRATAVRIRIRHHLQEMKDANEEPGT